MKQKRIGLFGGTFDPPHDGHLWIAEKALTENNLDLVIFIPTSQNPLKHESALFSAQERFDAVKDLIKNNPKFEVSEYEVFKTGVSYTIDTVKHFKSIFPNDELFLIMGEDAFADISKWKDSEELQQLIKIIVYPRELPISSTQIREKIKKSSKF